MGVPVVRVENLGKRYLLGRAGGVFGPWWRPARLRYSSRKSPNTGEPRTDEGDKTLWALRGISFEVHQGEVLGIVGRNGAGKSTLLKLLARITAPSEGRAEIRGRLGALLEVGTGFHPELTGRENIFLSGAMIGMKRSEIKNKFDEIVDFSELTGFIDTPVKRYSSGMYVRLAFAVAAHFEPDILLVDEVLAVGDAAFQRKCLGKMEGATRQGRTILFVSHNLAAINYLCSRSLLLEQGQLVLDGPSQRVTEEYMRRSLPSGSSSVYRVNRGLLQNPDASPERDVVVTEVSLWNAKGGPITALKTGDALKIRIGFSMGRRIHAPAFVVSIKDHSRTEVVRLSTMPISGYYIDSLEGDGAIELCIPELPLLGGSYFLSVHVARANLDWILRMEDVVCFEVTPTDVYSSGLALDNRRGLIALKHEWRLVSSG